MTDKTTGELLAILNRIKKKTDLTDFVEKQLNDEELITLPAYLELLLKKHSLEKNEVINQSNIPRTYAYQIFNGTRQPGRDKLMSLCLSMSLDIDETRRAFNVAGLGGLYPKRRRDAILIYAINKQLNVIDTNELLHEMNESPLT